MTFAQWDQVIQAGRVEQLSTMPHIHWGFRAVGLERNIHLGRLDCDNARRRETFCFGSAAGASLREEMNVPTDFASRSLPHWTTYAWGLALVGLATLFNLIAWTPAAGQDTHYFALILAVLLNALIGGVGPGLFSVALAVLSAAYFSLTP